MPHRPLAQYKQYGDKLVRVGPALDELGDLIMTKKWRYAAMSELVNQISLNGDVSEKLKGFTFLTLPLFKDKPSKDDNGKKYDERIVELLAGTLRQQSYRLSLRRSFNSEKCSIVSDYLTSVDRQIKEIDAEDQTETKQSKLFVFAEVFKELANRYSSPNNLKNYGSAEDVSFTGNSIVVSDNVGNHNHSVLILPTNPHDAVACLFEDQPRILFREYGGAESAESVVLELYGTDGKYAQFYQKFLDRRDQYSL